MKVSVKKLISLIAVLLMAAVFMTACSTSFTMTSSNSKVKIEATAADGDTAEANYITVGKDRVISISSELEKGKLQIDFVEATVTRDSRDNEEVTLGDNVASVTVEGNETKELELEKGEYVLQLTAIGETNGTVNVEVEKK